MPPVKRERARTSRGLPPRVYERSGTYWFVDRTGKWHKLARTIPEALRALADLQEGTGRTISRLIERYRAEVLPLKAARTQKGDAYILERLEEVFGSMAPAHLEPHHVWDFFEARGRCRQARLEVGVLSHLMTCALRWGEVRSNPCRGLQLPRNPPRRRYVTDREVEMALEAAPERLQAAIVIGLTTGLRLTDILSLSPESASGEGLLVETQKTGRWLVFDWTPELRAAVESWLAGGTITESGFQSAWQRLARRMGEHRFQFRDLRAKSASDSTSPQEAATRLGHSSAAITQRVYIRRPTRATVLRWKSSNFHVETGS